MSYSLVILFFSFLLHTAKAVLMDKLADIKLCGDTGCSYKSKLKRSSTYVLSMATALADFIAPDCRFVNIKRCQRLYVYSKLLPMEGAGVFWPGNVYSERYVDKMGIIGYFPANVVKETHIFVPDMIKSPTTVMDFYCE